MGLNKITSLFPSGKEINISYTWADIAAATGFSLMYGLAGNTSTGIKYALSPSTYISSLLTAQGLVKTDGTASTSNSFVKILDLDFDVTASQINQTIRGEGLVVVNWSNTTGAGSGGFTFYHSYAIIKIRKWDGASETEIASVQTATKEQTEHLTNADVGFTVPITIPKTTIKTGEQIRMTVELWGKGPGFSFTLKLKHDPANDSDNSRLGIAIPFKIEV